MPDQQKNSLTPSEWFSSSPAFRFKVPVYQRLFTWEEPQFDRLLEDLYNHFKNNENDDPYYLGIITVVEQEGKEQEGKEQKGKFILIDGQQRLTVITILAAMLRGATGSDINILDYIDYEARPDDRESLTKIWGNGSKWLEKAEEELQNTLEAENISSRSMCEFIMHIKRNYDKWSSLWEKVNESLTLLVSILPKEYTDDFKLQNEYFEKMNSAGKQLEPHEILKVRICSNEKDKNAFDKWNAIEDFTERYRDPSGEPCGKKTNETSSVCLFNAILEDVGEKSERKGSLEKWRPSLIDFPMFLLHVLNIPCGNKPDIPSDSHRLLEHFHLLLQNIQNSNKSFVEDMIKYRTFLDQWIIHRAIDTTSVDDGADDTRFRFWTDDNNESTYVNYVNEGKEDVTNLKMKFKQVQMALYALEGESQEWMLTVYQDNLDYDKTSDNSSTELEHLYIVLCNYLIEKSSFVENKEEGELWQINPRFQVDKEEWPDDYLTYKEHMRAAFICLDFFLWLLANSDDKDDATLELKGVVFGKDGPSEVITRFVPRANRSIEHFHPQTDGNSQNRGDKADNDPAKDGWKAVIKPDGPSVKDVFGNLALISAGRNSEYSNMSVGGKADLIVRSVEKKNIESIKLLLMKNACDGQDKKWLPETAREHAKCMKKVVLWGLNKAGYTADTTLSLPHAK